MYLLNLIFRFTIYMWEVMKLLYILFLIQQWQNIGELLQWTYSNKNSAAKKNYYLILLISLLKILLDYVFHFYKCQVINNVLKLGIKLRLLTLFTLEIRILFNLWFMHVIVQKILCVIRVRSGLSQEIAALCIPSGNTPLCTFNTQIAIIVTNIKISICRSENACF